MRFSFVPPAIFAAVLTLVQVPDKIDTIAGTGTKGLSGDGLPADRSALDQPFHCDFDPSGNLLIVDTVKHRLVRLIRKTGLIFKIAGNG
ncbi:MAG: hypothetical protein NVSMB14_04900 [Isosphaeraceae bacterium]